MYKLTNSRVIKIRSTVMPFGDYLHFFDPKANVVGLERLISESWFQEMIKLASPELYQSTQKYLQGKEFSAKKLRILRESVVKYGVRAFTRNTPFGTFSFTSEIHAYAATKLIDSFPHMRKHVRVSQALLSKIVKKIETSVDSLMENQIHLYVNPTLYRKGIRWYVAYFDSIGSGDKFNNISIRNSRVIEFAFQKSQKPITINRLIEEFALSSNNQNVDKFQKMVLTLIESGFLLTSLRVTMLRGDALSYLLQKIKVNNIVDTEKLQTIGHLALQYSTEKIGKGIQNLQTLTAACQIDAEIVSNPIHIDTHVDSIQLSISGNTFSSLEKCVDLLIGLSQRSNKMYLHLEEYREKFRERFGTSRVKVLELLDLDLGLGPPRTYQNPAGFYNRDNPHTELKEPFRDDLIKLVFQALKENKKEIVIDDIWASKFAPKTENIRLPKTIDLGIGGYIADSALEVDCQKMDVAISAVLGVSYPSGKLLGRFSFGQSGFATSIRQSVALTQHNTTAKIADLTYSTNMAQVFNLSSHVATSEYEVAVSSYDPDSINDKVVVPVSDLEIGLADEKFFIWSPSLNQEILPVSMHVLNPNNAPNVVRFLGDIYNEQYDPIYNWRWLDAETFPFLPRIKYQDIILSPAMWSTPDLTTTKDPMSLLESWRIEMDLPRFVNAGTHDNKLVLDLENEVHCQVLVNEIKKGVKSVEECIGISSAMESTGRFAELLIPMDLDNAFVRPNNANARDFSLRMPYKDDIVRYPLVQCVYLKLYYMQDLGDDLIKTLSQFWKNTLKNHSNYFFFIQYRDPKPHVRFRIFYTKDQAEACLKALSELNTYLYSNGLIAESMIDEYRRETDRYGGIAMMDQVEQVFFCNSLLIMGLFELNFGKLEGTDRYILAAYAVLKMLTDLGFDTTEQTSAYAFNYNWYKNRYHNNGSQFQEFWTKNKERVSKIFLGDTPENLAGMIQTINIFNNYPVEFAKNLRLHMDKSHQLSDIISSIIHMHCNRLGIDNFSEVFVYGTLVSFFNMQKYKNQLLSTQES